MGVVFICGEECTYIPICRHGFKCKALLVVRQGLGNVFYLRIVGRHIYT